MTYIFERSATLYHQPHSYCERLSNEHTAHCHDKLPPKRRVNEMECLWRAAGFIIISIIKHQLMAFLWLKPSRVITVSTQYNSFARCSNNSHCLDERERLLFVICCFQAYRTQWKAMWTTKISPSTQQQGATEWCFWFHEVHFHLLNDCELFAPLFTHPSHRSFQSPAPSIALILRQRAKMFIARKWF